MFAGRCPHCGRTMLLSLDDVSLCRDANGVCVRYRCPQGHELTWSPVRRP